MTNKSNKELKNIMAENEVFARITEEASARGEFAGGYANSRAIAYYEARTLLKERGVSVEG